MERYACIFGTNNASRSGFVREVIQGEENAVFRLHVPMLAYEGNYAIPSRSPYLVGLITKMHTQIGEPNVFSFGTSIQYFVLSDLPSRHGSTHQSMPFIVPSKESSCNLLGYAMLGLGLTPIIRFR